MMRHRDRYVKLPSHQPRKTRAGSPRQDDNRATAAFTLIELMAVVLVIALLSAIGLGVSSYVRRRLAISTTRSQIAAMEAALEIYKNDWGFYPASGPIRVDSYGIQVSSNNSYLYRALSGKCVNCSKVYLRFSVQQIQANMSTALTNIYDPFGNPYAFYDSPSTAYGVSNSIPAGWPPLTIYYGGYAVGGQVNIRSYDLWSFGPDGLTYVPGAIAYQGGYNYAWYIGVNGSAFTNMGNALDDITNFGR